MPPKVALFITIPMPTIEFIKYQMVTNNKEIQGAAYTAVARDITII